MKKFVLISTLAAAMTITTMVSATPVLNAIPGDFKVNVNYGFDQKEGNHDAKSRWTGGDATLGLPNHLAVQYAYNTTRGKTGRDVTEHYLNGLIRLGSYVHGFAGLSYIKADGDGLDEDGVGYQVGIRGQVPLAAKIVGFASVGVGNKSNTYLAGLGYKVTSDLDAHIQYRKSDIKVGSYDDSVKGWQVGLGYKFF